MEEEWRSFLKEFHPHYYNDMMRSFEHNWVIAEQTGYNTANKRIKELEKEVARLRELEKAVIALDGVAEIIAEWGGYASEYFQKKWNLAGDIAKGAAVDAAINALKEGRK